MELNEIVGGVFLVVGLVGVVMTVSFFLRDVYRMHEDVAAIKEHLGIKNDEP